MPSELMGRLGADSDTAADNDEISLNAVKQSHLGQEAPAAKTEALKQRQARCIVPKDKPQQRVEIDARRVRDGLAHEVRA